MRWRSVPGPARWLARTVVLWSVYLLTAGSGPAVAQLDQLVDLPVIELPPVDIVLQIQPSGSVTGDTLAVSELGRSLAAGDFNGDGMDDLAAGAPGGGAAARVAVLPGTPAGPDAASAILLSSGPAYDARYGAALAAGDVDGDGMDDLAIGMPLAKPNSRLQRGQGGVAIHTGSAGGLSPAPQATVFAPAADTTARFGAALALADVNGDGYDDLLVGAPDHAADAGKLAGAGAVYVYFGGRAGLSSSSTPDQVLEGSDKGMAFGSAIVAVGDVDQDGYGDIVIAAPLKDGSSRSLADQGALFLFLGSKQGLAARPAATAHGPGGSRLGTSLAAGPPGWFAAGAPGYTGTAAGEGAVFAVRVSRTTLGILLTPDLVDTGGNDGAALGQAVATLDFNGDGHTDIAAGGPGGAIGVVAVYAGDGAGAFTRLAFAIGQAAGSGFGAALVAGDLDGNGRADLAATAPLADGSAVTGAGRLSWFLRGLPDLQADSLTVSVPKTAYLEGRDPGTVAFDLGVSVGAQDTPQDFACRLEAVLVDGSGTEIAGAQPLDLGRIAVPAAAVARRGVSYAPGTRPHHAFTIDLAAVGYASWFASHLPDGARVAFRLFLDVDDVYLEGTGEDNNTFFDPSAAVDLLPLSGALFFGDVRATLQEVSLAADGACGQAPKAWRIAAGRFSWQPSADTALWQPQADLDPSGLCITLSPPAGGGPLEARVASGQVAVGPLAGKIGGLAAELAAVVLDKGGITPGDLDLHLPAGHSLHAALPGSTPPYRAAGRGMLTVGAASLVLPSPDLADLTATVSVNAFLHAPALPFLLLLEKLVLGRQEVSGTWSEALYLHNVSFAAGDPRSVRGIASNDGHFRRPADPAAQPDQTFTLRPSGLAARVLFEQGEAWTHFPRVRRRWDAFQVRIVDGRIQPGTGPLAGRGYAFAMQDACGAAAGECPGSTAAPRFDLQAAAAGMAPDGGVLAVVTAANKPGTGVDPGWGPYSAARGRHTFAASGFAGRPGVLYLPGFEAVGTRGVAGSLVPVSRYLLGMRRAEKVQDTTVVPASGVELLGSVAARLGNAFMAGLTQGPEMLVGAGGLPEQGAGSTLAGAAVSIAFGGWDAGPDVKTVVLNKGTKVVIRPGGLTGVFNTDQPPSEVLVYGYRLAVRRFAFRQVGNRLDPYTWFDGGVHVPGKGDFHVSFSSLRLACTGDLLGGTVDREPCNGADDNHNGLVDENCGQRLAHWQMPFEVLDMDFAPDSGVVPSACTAVGRHLSIGSLVRVAALDDPLGLRAAWSADGEPSDATITGATDNVLDRPEKFDSCTGDSCDGEDNQGFDVALGNAALRSSAADGGWLQLAGSLGLPFWDALDAHMRVANQDAARQKQSLLLPQPGLLTGGEDDVLGLMAETPFSVHYAWGATGFEFSLPVVFEPGNHAERRPRFVGRKKTKRLVVIDLAATADYVTPSRTKISFGASAEKAELLAAIDAIDFHVDPGDPASLARADQLLNTLGVSGTPVADVLGPVQSGLAKVRAIGDSGLDDILRRAVSQGVEEAVGLLGAGDLLGGLADRLNVLQSVPERLAAAITGNTGALLDRLSRPLTSGLDRRLLDIYLQLPSLLEKQYAGTLADTSAFQPLVETLDLADGLLSQARAAVAGVQGEVNQAAAAVIQVIDGVAAPVADARSAVAQVRRLFAYPDGVASSCGRLGNTGNPIVDQAIGRVSSLQADLATLRDALEKVALLDFATAVAGVAGVDTSAIDAAQADVRDLAEELSGQLSTVTAALDGALGGLCTGLDSALSGMDGVLARIDTELGGVASRLAAVRIELTGTGSTLALVADTLAGADRHLGAIAATVAELRRAVEQARDGGAVSFQGMTTAADIRARLDQLVQVATGNRYRWYYPAAGPVPEHTFAAELVTSLRAPVEFAIAQAVARAEGALGGLLDELPQPSGEDLQGYLVAMIMDQPAIGQLGGLVHDRLGSVKEEVDRLAGNLFDQVNQVLAGVVEAVNSNMAAAMEAASGAVEGMPLTAASLDGYAEIGVHELERLHVTAEWTLEGSSKEDTTSYNAALDVESWNVNGKAAQCLGSVPGAAPLDVAISTRDMRIDVGGSEVNARKIYLGFTLDTLTPIGVFGGIDTEGTLDFETFNLYDVAFACGVGSKEVYVGASAGASFQDIQMQVAFLVGRTCNLTVLQDLDPQAAEFIVLPNGMFSGAYARGSASVPIYNYGCLFTIGVGADVGAWYLQGPPSVVGGLLGGSAYGKLGCLAAVRGSVTLMGQKVGDAFTFRGEGFGVAGVGSCEPETWTSVPRSRSDSWCGTCDAQFGATYDNGWSVDSPEASCLH